MPIGFLSDAERERLDSFLAQVVLGDMLAWGRCSKGGSTATGSYGTGMTCCGWPDR